VIRALSEKGKRALSIQKKEEEELRAKYKDLKRSETPRDMRRYLKTVSVFMPAVEPVEHQILGFKKFGSVQKHQFYQGVKRAFLENGCSLDDFEVKFYDD
jgi:hypothetical protein